MKGKYLITTDEWFIAPNGEQYKAVWGDVEILSDNILGVKTNSRSANWFAKIGNEENHIIVAGCQIHYAAKSEDKPSSKPPISENWHNGELITQESTSRIYFTE